ncbi:MAG: Crp/Fnr family transcriptional regulator [Betaproteobacteria bacterium]|nr:MAG: Crp/Fnr family transcriptional regulator [Betaproteobacteria bacterium]
MRREIKLEAFLANLPLFRGLGEEALARLGAGARRLRLARGDTLFHEGERPEGFYAVVHGEIRLTRDAGRLVNLIGAGRTFGEPVMYLEKPYHLSATALKDSLLVQVSKPAVLAEIERNPKFARRVIVDLARRVEMMVRELETYALGSAVQRLISYLLREAPPAAPGGFEMTLPMAKRALASRLNLSAEHLSRILGELQERGLLEVRGRRIRIPDLPRLRGHRGARGRGGSRKAVKVTAWAPTTGRNSPARSSGC